MDQRNDVQSGACACGPSCSRDHSSRAHALTSSSVSFVLAALCALQLRINSQYANSFLPAQTPVLLIFGPQLETLDERYGFGLRSAHRILRVYRTATGPQQSLRRAFLSASHPPNIHSSLLRTLKILELELISARLITVNAIPCSRKTKGKYFSKQSRSKL